MTDTAEFPYRLANSWISIATLEGSATYLLTAFAVQSDQYTAHINPWGPPADEGTLFPAATRYGQHSDTPQWADGPITVTWTLAYLTEGMVDKWENNIIFSNKEEQFHPVTIKTRKSNGNFSVYQGYANRAVP